jgi:hypothetical protein
VDADDAADGGEQDRFAEELRADLALGRAERGIASSPTASADSINQRPVGDRPTGQTPSREAERAQTSDCHALRDQIPGPDSPAPSATTAKNLDFQGFL